MTICFVRVRCLRTRISFGDGKKESKAVNTDYQSPETPEHLKEKAAPYAENWTPTAEKLWNKEKRKDCSRKSRRGTVMISFLNKDSRIVVA